MAGDSSSGDAASGTTTASTVQPTREPYRIGAGDVLQITVWKEPDLSVPLTQVRSDGQISVPLVGDVTAAGLTPKELETTLKSSMAPIVLGADVFVLIKEVHSEKVFVIGAVKREGSIVLTSPMTVLQILAEAGGLTEYAKSRKIYILRTIGGRQEKLAFDYEAVIRGRAPDQNILVWAGDTLVVPR